MNKADTIKSKQDQLAHLLNALENQITNMRKDVAGGYLPRYGGHVAATAREIEAVSNEIRTINDYMS